MKDQKILKKNNNIVTRTFGKQTLLMPLYKTSEELDCIYTLDAIGARIWQLINGKRTAKEIKGILLEEFDIAPATLNKDLDIFLKDLEEIRAVKCRN